MNSNGQKQDINIDLMLTFLRSVIEQVTKNDFNLDAMSSKEHELFCLNIFSRVVGNQLESKDATLIENAIQKEKFVKVFKDVKVLFKKLEIMFFRKEEDIKKEEKINSFSDNLLQPNTKIQNLVSKECKLEHNVKYLEESVSVLCSNLLELKRDAENREILLKSALIDLSDQIGKIKASLLTLKIREDNYKVLIKEARNLFNDWIRYRQMDSIFNNIFRGGKNRW